MTFNKNLKKITNDNDKLYNTSYKTLIIVLFWLLKEYVNDLLFEFEVNEYFLRI